MFGLSRACTWVSKGKQSVQLTAALLTPDESYLMKPSLRTVHQVTGLRYRDVIVGLQRLRIRLDVHVIGIYPGSSCRRKNQGAAHASFVVKPVEHELSLAEVSRRRSAATHFRDSPKTPRQSTVSGRQREDSVSTVGDRESARRTILRCPCANLRYSGLG